MTGHQAGTPEQWRREGETGPAARTTPLNWFRRRDEYHHANQDST